MRNLTMKPWNINLDGDSRVYVLVEGFEVELDLNCLSFDNNGNFFGLGVILEGPLQGYEILVPSLMIADAVKDWEDYHGEELI